MTTTEATTPDFSRLIDARSIAIVGASNNFAVVSGQPVRFLTELGYQGKVHLVNPKYADIQGTPCYPDLSAVPGPVDVALIAIGARHVPATLEKCRDLGIPYAIVLSAGFREAGESGAALERDLQAAIRRTGVRVIGPNCMGVFNLRSAMRAGFGSGMAGAGKILDPIALIAQSGGFGQNIITGGERAGVGFSHFVTTGNEADISSTELMAYFLERPDTEAVVAYLEGTTDGRRLRAMGRRALELGKPIIVWKVGNTAAGKLAATSHTGRLTAGYELIRTAFREGGFVEVSDMDELYDVIRVLRARKFPKGNRSVVVCASGGAGVLLADQMALNGIELPRLPADLIERIRPCVPEFASFTNPIDSTPTGYHDNYAGFNRLIREVLASDAIDSAIIRSIQGKGADIWAREFAAILHATDKPVLLNWISGPGQQVEIAGYLESQGIACLYNPTRTARTLGSITDFALRRARAEAAARRGAVRAIAPQALDLPAGAQTLGERASKAALARYGIPVVGEAVLAPEAIERLDRAPLAFPLAVKIDSPDIPHKTEAGGVELGIASLDALKAAARRVVDNALRYRPGARIDGILLQEMASGTEVIVGVANDPAFGPCVLFGLGGIFTELMGDVTRRFAPFDAVTAREMIGEIKAAKLFEGYRGRPALDVDALADVLARVSLLAADHADRIAEIDVNPLFVRPRGQGVVAADALLVLRPGSQGGPRPPQPE